MREEIDGLTTAGSTLGEVKRNMYEVINDHLEYMEECKETALSITDLKINFGVDLEQFFSYLNVFNKTAFAEYAGIKQSLFRQYTRGLAPISGKKMNRISNDLHKLADDR